MEIKINDKQSIFDLNQQYYGTMNNLQLFIEDNKDIMEDLFMNFKGLTVSFRDELLSKYSSNITSYTENLGTDLTEIENLVIGDLYYDYNGLRYIMNNMDILGAKAFLDKTFTPLDPTIKNYEARATNTGLNINDEGTILTPKKNKSTKIEFDVYRQDGTTDIYVSERIDIDKQEYTNISLKQQLSTGDGYGTKFFSEMTDASYLVEGNKRFDSITPSNAYSLDPNNLYYTDLMPAFLGNGSLFLDFVGDHSLDWQLMNIGFRENFKIDYYPQLQIDFDRLTNKIFITNNDVSSSSGREEIFPTKCGYNIAVNNDNKEFDNILQYNTSYETLAIKFLYNCDKDIIVIPGDDTTQYTLPHNITEYTITDAYTIYNNPVFLAHYFDKTNIINVYTYDQTAAIIENQDVYVSGSTTVIQHLDVGSYYVLDIFSIQQRELNVNIDGIDYYLNIPQGTGELYSDVGRILFSLSDNDNEINEFEITTLDPIQGIISYSIYSVFQNGITIPRTYTPNMKHTIELNQNLPSSTYYLKFNSDGYGKLKIDGITAGNINNGTNEFTITKALTNINMEVDGDIKCTNFSLEKVGQVHILSNPQIYEIDLNINKCPPLNWNLFSFVYTKNENDPNNESASFYFNGTPIRYLLTNSMEPSELSEAHPFKTINESNEFILVNKPNQKIDFVTHDAAMVSRDDIYNLMDIKFNKK